jgi:hypothetical protein
MKTKLKRSAGTNIATGEKPRAATSTRQKVTQATRAQRGLKLLVVRENGPEALCSMLLSMAAEGQVTVAAFADDYDLASEAMNADSMLELELGDEDDFDGAVWSESDNRNEVGSFVLGPDRPALPLGENPFTGDVFSLVVSCGTCSFVKPDWVGCFVSRTPDGQHVLHEISTRFSVLDKIASWLSDSRSGFLQSRDFWDLGPNNRKELFAGLTPVRQKAFLPLLALKQEVSEASFSRFIRASQLVWQDGTAPLNILFSEDARMAWVAKSIWLFAEGRLTESVLSRHANIKVQKGGAPRNSLLRTPVNSMDFPTFIEYANLCAGTTWREVLERYQERMVVPHGRD